MAQQNIGGLIEKRRSALVEYCLGHFGEDSGDLPFLKTPADLFEFLRMDPLDSYPVQSSWLAEATSCAQQFIHAAYRKLEPGYVHHPFSPADLKLWELYSNYPDWAAVTLIAIYPENFMSPFVRQRKTGLFKTLENDMNQTRLSNDSVQVALQNYLQAFEQTCNLDVVSAYMDGESPSRADYYIVGRQRVPPFQYYWRKAEIELVADCNGINPAAWGEWQPVEIATGGRVLDMRMVFWSGRCCLTWAEWHDKVAGKTDDEFISGRLDISLAFMTQNGQWSSPLLLHSSEREEAEVKDTRMVATIMVGEDHPKGKLGLLLTGAGDKAIRVYTVRDVLFRPVVDDDGLWLDTLANERFTDTSIVQHPLSQRMVRSVETAGSLTRYYGLEVLFSSGAKQDTLMFRGRCKRTSVDAPQSTTFTLSLLNGDSGDPQPIKFTETTAGGWVSQWLTIKRDPGVFDKVVFTLGANSLYGVVRFTVATSHYPRFVPPALEKNSNDAAQFLAFKQPGTLAHVRLNSLFGPDLVMRSNISIDAVLDWDTQFLTEPPPDRGPIEEPNGAFNGANGVYFWELFFHLPHLVATRLQAEDRYPEAQNWLHYLFDPRAPADPPSQPPSDADKPLYWRCRPLNSMGSTGCETQKPIDPDAIGYSAPRHFKIMVFIDYVKNLIAWGDWYYRQLTRDSLVAAKLCYVQAEFLMGRPPVSRTVTSWETTTVEVLLKNSSTRPALEKFEKDLDFSLADLPPSADSPPLMGLLANEPFKLPINEQLLGMFDLPGQRLHNLRNNLTLDGKPLLVPLFSPPTDPNQLLRDLAAGGVGGPRPMGGRSVVAAFNWRVMFDAAMRAVQTLQEYGNQVLRLLEQRDRAEQEELQQNHLVELGNYAQTVQELTITQLEANVSALRQSRATAQARAEAYAKRYEQNISDVEYDVMDSLQQSKQQKLASVAIKGGGAVLASLPNIFGLSNGGHRLEKLADAVVFGLELSSMALQMDADKQSVTEGYRRRRSEWGFQRDQALSETLAIDEQITAQQLAVDAARASLVQTLRANDQALTVYNYLKKRATNVELFGWLLGQLKTLHYQAYDAVVSLCMSAQASLSAATGDYASPVALPQVWLDNRHGLTAGEHLREYLLRMERQHLQSFERRIERVKTISLRLLFDDAVEPQMGFSNWETALVSLQKTGTLEFKVTQLLLDRDHPGEYCRLINSVELDLPMLAGPYENTRATLLQIGSMTATQASPRSVEYLHRSAGKVAPSDVQFNLRSGQQIGVSVGLADNGMTALKGDEGLLNPFENTGVVSHWQLNFPWPAREPQSSMLLSVTDIIVRIRYTAKVGEPSFRLAVGDLVTLAETSGQPAPANGADHHA